MLYRCIEATTDVWNSTSWEATNVGNEIVELTNSLSIKTLTSQSKELINITHKSVTLKNMRADISNGMCTIYGLLSVPTNATFLTESNSQLGTLIDELIPVASRYAEFTAWAGRGQGTIVFS